MDNILVISQSIPQIGYVARTCTQGEEFDMVNLFINSIIEKYTPLKTKHAAIFIEPQIDTGYPDIVIVEYHTSSLPTPNEARKRLSATDLKILYHIHCKKSVTVKDLSRTLAYPPEEIRRSLHRLANAKLLYLSKRGNSVRKMALSKYCPIKKIIAIEAKVDKWNDAITQAEHNIWFATESYVLLNKEKCSPTVIERCHEKGIGLISVNKKIEMVLKSTSRKFPISYASLQFNEWLCKYSHLQEE